MEIESESMNGLAGMLAGLVVMTTLLPWVAGRKATVAGVRRWAEVCGWLGLVLAVVAALLLVAGGGRGSGGVLEPVVYFDGISAAMLLMVALLGAVIQRYGASYLGGEARQGQFIRWLSLTLGAVQLVVVSGHLLVLFGAWLGTSYGLHRLLVYYGDRPGALLAARKKFLVSRLGDLCLLGAIVLIAATWGTLGLEELMRRVPAGDAGWAGQVIALLLVGGALLKSAQVPFHTWLPETMETPTPVSALMHAGIINAGGFLVIRLSVLVAPSGAALHLLAVVGAVTAVTASVIMLTQTSIKKTLAYSTISQMGFMLMQCGLGAFAMALLHILAHSLYKAHAFLRSGSVVGGATELEVVRTAGGSPLRWVFGLLVASAVLVVYMLLYRGAEGIFGSYVAAIDGERPGAALVGLLVIGLFALTLALQLMVPRWRGSAWVQALQVHATNGFYLGTLASRMVNRLWPTVRG